MTHRSFDRWWQMREEHLPLADKESAASGWRAALLAAMQKARCLN